MDDPNALQVASETGIAGRQHAKAVRIQNSHPRGPGCPDFLCKPYGESLGTFKVPQLVEGPPTAWFCRQDLKCNPCLIE